MGAITRLSTGGGSPARAKSGGVYADYGEGTSIVIGEPASGGGGTRSRTGRNRSRGGLWIVLFLALWVA